MKRYILAIVASLWSVSLNLAAAPPSLPPAAVQALFAAPGSISIAGIQPGQTSSNPTLTSWKSPPHSLSSSEETTARAAFANLVLDPTSNSQVCKRWDPGYKVVLGSGEQFYFCGKCRELMVVQGGTQTVFRLGDTFETLRKPLFDLAP